MLAIDRSDVQTLETNGLLLVTALYGFISNFNSSTQTIILYLAKVTTHDTEFYYNVTVTTH